MTDRLFADCCYGTDQQHLPSEPCPVEPKVSSDVEAVARALMREAGGADADSWCSAKPWYGAARAAIDTLRASDPSRELVEGYALVPIAPTEAMIRAVDKAAMNRWPNARKMAVDLWAAAIGAARTQGQ